MRSGWPDRMPRKLCRSFPSPTLRADRHVSEGVQRRPGGEAYKGRIGELRPSRASHARAQERHYAELMPRIGIVYQPRSIDLAAVSAETNPKILEIGCVLETTAAGRCLARQRLPRRQCTRSGCRRICKQAAERGLTNLRICQHDAVEVVATCFRSVARRRSSSSRSHLARSAKTSGG